MSMARHPGGPERRRDRDEETYSMAGPYPPPPAGAEGNPTTPDYRAEPYPYPPGYPAALPPPVGYPTGPARSRAIWWVLGALAVVGALVAAVVAFGTVRTAGGSGAFTDASAERTIQNYLTALSDGDTEVVARNTACGMFDALKDRRSDLALARLASDAFRKQFNRAEVVSIDKIVLSSAYQAQVLFTMRVAPNSRTRNARDEEQGVAQLLRQGDQLLVCSYLLRTAAQF
jgi:hypothetical protein